MNSFNYSAEQALNILTSLENELGNITVNNQPIKQLKEIIINNKLAFDNLENSQKLGVLHNNLYFSNIFYLPAISGVKLISPLGNGDNLFGDVRLDYAMLKLNYALKIEQIEKELFRFSNTSENNFNLIWLCDQLPTDEFDKIIGEYQNIYNVNLLTVLLAINKLPALNSNQQVALIYSILENISI